MFNLGKLKIYITIATILITIISWKFYEYNRIIVKQQAEIEKLRKAYVTLKVDLQTERENVKLVTAVVEDQHKTIDKLKARNQDIVTKYNNFRLQADNEKYKTEQALALMQSKLFSSSTCEDGLELNRMISKLKYDDL